MSQRVSSDTTNLRPGPGAVLLVVRLLLGGLFLLAAAVKINSPQSFLEAIQAFRIIDDSREQIQTLLTFAVPYTEFVLAVCLLAGFWTRAAAGLVTLMLLGFTAGVLSVIARNMSISCGCFGDLTLVCPKGEPMGWCKVGENAAMLAMALVLVGAGGGLFSADAIGQARRR